MIKIELLYFDGCPSWRGALDNLNRALAMEHLSAQVELIEVATPQRAQEERFLGSPSFRINGVDLWGNSKSRFDLNCRVYETPEGMRGIPTVEMLRERIRALLKEK